MYNLDERLLPLIQSVANVLAYCAAWSGRQLLVPESMAGEMAIRGRYKHSVCQYYMLSRCDICVQCDVIMTSVIQDNVLTSNCGKCSVLNLDGASRESRTAQRLCLFLCSGTKKEKASV